MKYSTMQPYLKLSLTVFGVALFSSSCCHITPPPVSISKDKQASGEVAAELEELNVSGKLSGSWKSTVNRTFDKLDDNNATYYMLLQAVECESRRGNKEMAQNMFNLLEEEMRHRRTNRKAFTLPPEVESKRQEVIMQIK